MSRSVEHAKIETPTSRAKLKRGKRHYQLILTGKAHLGYRREEGAPHGRWFLRRNLGDEKYQYLKLGVADDQKGIKADGVMVLDFEQAKADAAKTLEQGPGSEIPTGPLTVRRAMADYVEHLQSEGKRTKELEQRAAALILPALGDTKVDELTTKRIEKWKVGLIEQGARLRTKGGAQKHKTKPKPEDDETIRKRKNSANRVLTMLKACLNLAYKHDAVTSKKAWELVERFKGADAARVRYLTVAEAQRLINACDPNFRLLVRAALETGARYQELARLKVEDFNVDSGTVAILMSKAGKARHVTLTEEGIAFFRQITMARPKKELMLRNEGRVDRALERERQRLQAEGKDPAKAKVDDDRAWKAAEQAVPMRDACKRASIDPPVSIHIMRHTWASLSVMAGMPLQVVARNLGHADIQMVQKHYGHLSDDYVAKAIRDSAPRFGFEADEKIKPFKAA